MKKLFFAVLALYMCTFAMAKGSFAIVIDPESHRQAKTEVDSYASAIERQNGYSVIILEDKWGVPDSIRVELKKLWEKKNLQGVVFIGDIPVAMVRDAQHFASAFKMDQDRYSKKRSSIPSDRYYDDFELEFESLGREEGTSMFYYALKAESVQKLQPSIVSGRIRPCLEGGKTDYSKLKAYLNKAVAAKNAGRKLQNIFFFAGQGYISESKEARMDEKIAWMEHFPWLEGREQHIFFMDNDDYNPVKEKLMGELQREDIDFAVLHHHGAPDTEYLNKFSKPNNSDDNKKAIQRYIRGKINDAKPEKREEVKAKLLARFDVPESWAEYSTEDIEKDSLQSASLDLSIADFEGYGYQPNVPVVMLDACFNGSFQLDDCIADEYIFQPGGTITVIANSVNSLQDRWSDKLAGLIAEGGCVGDIAKYCGYIETHIIGDPTYRFTNDYSKKRCPDYTVLDIENRHRAGKISSSELRKIYECSPYGIVREQALECLADFRNDDFIEVLKLAAYDSYEFCRRMAVKYMGENGDERLIPTLLDIVTTNNLASRVRFDARYALSAFSSNALLAEYDKNYDGKQRDYIASGAAACDEDIKYALDDDAPFKDRKLCIRALRNHLNYSRIPELAEYVQTCSNPEIQVLLLEALGWHRYAHNADKVITVAKSMSENASLDPSVRKEALRTYNRLK